MKKPSLQEYDNGWGDNRAEIVNMGLVELSEKIEQFYDNKPKKRDRNSWRDWKKAVNSLVKEYNTRVGFDAFAYAH